MPGTWRETEDGKRRVRELKVRVCKKIVTWKPHKNVITGHGGRQVT